VRVSRTIASALVTGAALLAAQARGAESACFSDAARVCPEVKPGDPGFLTCLRGHQDALSKSCKRDLEKLDRRAAEFQRDCGGDALRLCRDVPRGEGRILECLNARAMILSPECAEAVAIAYERVDVLERACRAEVEEHCAGVPASGARRFLCLESKKGLLSDGCREALHL
jgi:hypothetical protein